MIETRNDEQVKMGSVRIVLPTMVWDFLEKRAKTMGITLDKLCEMSFQEVIEKIKR